jgi:hypothetical protein
MIPDSGFWILDIRGFHRWCIDDYPASSIKHPESAAKNNGLEYVNQA